MFLEIVSKLCIDGVSKFLNQNKNCVIYQNKN